ncbi:MBL fold metallo-hydrolase [Clostridium sp. HBUAS56010]|uniref:MBL fold metallo-hydrolase n=1 Tax=Clostridium sp. HBUAS56010 TaxID=2571127 RepID=UPI0011782C5D|nr:MBL fold metallo-hydrolase [Clostridium sp. HBUAS56010]
MQIKIVVDNHVIDSLYRGEPAVSFYIEVDGLKLLFDTGFSDLVISNARKMGIELSELTHIVLSHGHNDHTNGLKYLDQTVSLSGLKVISHPHCFYPKKAANQFIGAPFTVEEMEAKCNYIPTKTPLFISDHCVFLGQIPNRFDFEPATSFGKKEIDGIWEDDYLPDDSAVVLKTSKGLFIVTGCSHSGICNIVEYAKEICKEDKIAGILGGLHLLDVDERLARTIKYMESCHIGRLYPCHCVSLLAKARLIGALPVGEAGVGLTINL